MKNKKKEVSVLVMTHNDHLVLQRLQHEDKEILSLPGNSNEGVSDLVTKILGKEYLSHLQKFGKAVDVVIKPGETVEISIDVFKIEVIDGGISLPEGFAWFSHEQILTDPRCRRDKKFYLRLLEDKPLDLAYSEEQLGKWIDAKILYWRE